MKPSSRLLDQNLEKLLQRAYRPVRPRPVFVQDLEESLATWLRPVPRVHPAAVRSDPSQGGRGRWWVAGLAAAAALLLLINMAWRNEPGGEGLGRSVASLAQLLEGGDIALRFGGEEAWRAATDEERLSGVDYPGGQLSLATPLGARLDVRGPDGWLVGLREATTLSITTMRSIHAAKDRVVFDLGRGRAEFSSSRQSRELSAVEQLFWQDGSFYDGSGLAWTASTGPSETSERQAVPVAPDAGSPQEAMPESPLPGRALLSGNLTLEAAAPSYQVTLLRAVPLPQVAMGETRSFDSPEFSWNDLTPGVYTVYVTAPGYAVWKTGDVDLGADRTVEVEISLDTGTTIRGFVVEESTGRGVPGALVVSENDMPAQVIGMAPEYFPDVARAYTFTKHDGSFELTPMSTGIQRLRASGKGHAPTWLERETTGERTDGLLLELGPGGAVEGRCEHADGTPFVEGMVIVSRFTGGGLSNTMTFEQASTDEAGRYRVEDLSLGTYVVLFFGAPTNLLESYQPEYQPILVKAGEVARANFLGAARGASVHGVVTDGEGQPIPSANLHVWKVEEAGQGWRGGTADEDGRYELVGLQPGNYVLHAGKARSTIWVADLNLAAGDRIEQDIQLQGFGLEVRIVDDVTGAPVDMVDLILKSRDPSASQFSLPAKVFSEANGIASFAYLKTGAYDLVVTSADRRYGLSVVRDVWIHPDTGVSELEVRLLETCEASLQVLDSKGLPMVGALVQLVAPDGEAWPTMSDLVSDGEGRVNLIRLHAGAWTCEVSRPGYATVWTELRCKIGLIGRGEVTLLVE